MKCSRPKWTMAICKSKAGCYGERNIISMLRVTGNCHLKPQIQYNIEANTQLDLLIPVTTHAHMLTYK